MSKITSDGLTRSGTECFIAVPVWQQWALKGKQSQIERFETVNTVPLHDVIDSNVACVSIMQSVPLHRRTVAGCNGWSWSPQTAVEGRYQRLAMYTFTERWSNGRSDVRLWTAHLIPARHDRLRHARSV